MTYARPDLSSDTDTLPAMPAWVTDAGGETSEDVAFLSGAALAHLHLVVGRDETPQSLLGERLALRAAEASVIRNGRPERVGDLRDAAAFLQPGDDPGPAGAIYETWRRAVARPISVEALHRVLSTLTAEQVATALDAGQGAPITRAAATLETVLAENPREEAAALILADAALAQGLGWGGMLPLLACGIQRADLGKGGDDLRRACHRAAVASAAEAVRLAADLARRAGRLRALAPKLRAKGAGGALEMFLTRDALAPSALATLRSDRAARRFCDRLVELGVARELTGRDTFRLYGL